MLMALAGSIFAVSQNPLLLAIAAVFGTISPSGKEVGPFLSIEQAILPQTTEDQYRTTVLPLTISLDHSVERLAHWPWHCRRSSL
jgi:hypothetical protein